MVMRAMLSVCGLLAVAVLPAAVHAVPKYAKLIPNGSGVSGVTAVGHTDPDNGGATNAFGKAFAAADYTWTEALCKADTDGDGQTNGEELGDPCCVWKSGGTPAVPSGAKDPGSASSKLDDATLTKSRALCKSSTPAVTTATPAATTAAPAAAATDSPGTVKPADGSTNATPALTPGAPAATPAAASGSGSTAATTAPADTTTAPAESSTTSGSSDYDWVPMDSVKSSSSKSSSNSSSTSSASSSTTSKNSTNTSSAAVPATLARGVSPVFQLAAAAVVGALALAL